MTEFNREIFFRPAFDRRDPNPSKNYGIHGCDLVFVLNGEKGAVQFVIYTNWNLPHVQREMDEKPCDPMFPYMFHKPMPADVGYHSPVPIYEGQELVAQSCKYLGGKPCYYDGSVLHANEVFTILVEQGSEGVWRHLEEYYHRLFDEVGV